MTEVEAMAVARESELRAEVAKDYSDWTLAQVEKHIECYMEGYRRGLQNGAAEQIEIELKERMGGGKDGR